MVLGAGGEAATWKGTGLGIIGEGGAVSFRGALYYSTAATAWAKLNRVAAVYEYEADPGGAVSAVTWEWS